MKKYRLTSSLGTMVQIDMNYTTLPVDTIVILAIDHDALIREAREALESIRQYGADTLSGRVDGPADTVWLRDGIREMTRRASQALEKTKESYAVCEEGKP